MIYLNDYKTFDDVQEMNLHVKQHISRHYYEMNDTEREVIYFISRYSVKYAGASHLKMETIAKAIDRSISTAKRVITKLIKLGIIERVTTLRAIKGGHGANIYRILPFVSSNEPSKTNRRGQAEKPTQTSAEETDKQDETINLISNNSSNTYDSREPIESISAEQVIHESITNNTPEAIVGLFRPFFYGSELYRYIGLLFKAKHRPHCNIRIESHINDYRACIYDVMRRYKQGYIRNLDSYLFASIRALSRRLFLTAA